VKKEKVFRCSPAQLKMMSDPLREHIVNSLTAKAKSVGELAAELDCAPTRLYHHIRRLVQVGLVVVDRQAPVRGLIESYYRTPAPVLLLDRQAFALNQKSGGAGIRSILNYASKQSHGEVLAAVRRGRVDLSTEWPDPKQVIAWRMVARLTPAQAAAMRLKLRALYRQMERLGQQRPIANTELCSLSMIFVPVDPATQRVRSSSTQFAKRPRR
jgi:DNA-binding transcriptional ArsR family regulator